MAERESVKIINAALDEVGDEIVLRGIVDTDSLLRLQVADYQREILSSVKIGALMDAHRNGRIPDIELGMRGQKFTERGEAFYLQDPVFIIDGLQRVTAGLRLVELGEGECVHLGATILFDTTEESERERFRILNQTQTKLSPNIHLRNMRHDKPVADALYKVCDMKGFVLYGRVAWTQDMNRGSHLITALTVAKTVGMLHSHAGPGRYTRVNELVDGLQKIMDNIGRADLIWNTRAFFEVVDGAWGIQNVAYRSTAVHLKESFLRALAKLFSEHTNFWEGNRLVVDKATMRKLATFPVHDPTVLTFAGGGKTGSDALFNLLVGHVNSGRRQRRLVPRGYVDLSGLPELGEEQGDGDE